LLPDVVVMDLNMPGLNGVEATREIVAANPGIAVLVLTMLDEDESVFAVMRAGARGYVKGADTDDPLRPLEIEASADFEPVSNARDTLVMRSSATPLLDLVPGGPAVRVGLPPDELD
jgi:chemotaxis response regulator CheB